MYTASKCTILNFLGRTERLTIMSTGKLRQINNSVKILPIDFFEDHCIWAALFLLENVPNIELEYS